MRPSVSPGMRAFYTRNQDGLCLVRSMIEEIVPRAYAKCAEFDSPDSLSGGTLGTVFREYLRLASASPALTKAGLRPRIGANTSVVLADRVGGYARVRKLPVDWKRRRELQLEYEQLEFSFDPFDPGKPRNAEELLIFWRPKPLTETLDRVVLAAVCNLKDSSKTAIHDFIDLPSDPAGGVGSIHVPDPPTPGDFEEFFGDATGLTDAEGA